MATETFDLHGFTRKLAAEMGAEWEADIPTDDHYCERANVRHVDDKTCSIHMAGPARYGSHGKLQFSGSLVYHHGAGSGLRYNEHPVSINVSTSKTPGQVAKDIKRRLLPTYLDQHARNVQAVAAAEDYDTQQKALNAAIDLRLSAFSQAHRNSNGVYLYKKTVNATTFTLELNSLTLDTFDKILALLP